MSIISGLTPAISYLTQDEEGNPKTAEDYKENFKDYIFDYTDPSEYATLPLYALGPAGIAANRAIKAGRVANKAFKPSGIQSFLSKPGVNVGIPSATLAGDVTYDLATDEEFMGDIKTIAGIEDDALDQANEDLKEVNEKEEQEVADAEDMDDPSEEEEKKGIGEFQDQLASFQKMMAPGEMTGGNIIASSGIDTPEIRRYAGGGIAQLVDEEVSGYVAGGLVNLGKGIFKKGKDFYKKTTKKEAKEKGVDVDKKKPATKKEETDITKDKPIEDVDSFIPPGIAMFGSKATDLVKQIPTPKRQVGRAVFYGVPAVTGLSYGADALFGDDENKGGGGGSKAAEVKLPEPDTMKDILYQNSLERAISAGRTEPSFMDYLASFPGSYTEKVGKDPEFAKQMMAGFMAMMKPTEGFVPRNALVDFGEAAYAEQARQQDAVPDQLQLIKEFAENPELAKAYRDFQRSAEPVDLVTEQQNRELLFRNLQTMIFGEKFDEDDDIPVDIRTGQPADPFNVYNEFIALGGDTAALIKIKENYAQP